MHEFARLVKQTSMYCLNETASDFSWIPYPFLSSYDLAIFNLAPLLDNGFPLSSMLSFFGERKNFFLIFVSTINPVQREHGENTLMSVDCLKYRQKSLGNKWYYTFELASMLERTVPTRDFLYLHTFLQDPREIPKRMLKTLNCQKVVIFKWEMVSAQLQYFQSAKQNIYKLACAS